MAKWQEKDHGGNMPAELWNWSKDRIAGPQVILRSYPKPPLMESHFPFPIELDLSALMYEAVK